LTIEAKEKEIMLKKEENSNSGGYNSSLTISPSSVDKDL